MPIEVRKKEKETTQSVIHRFTKAVRGGGVLISARRRRFHSRAKGKLARKISALRRQKSTRERELLNKMGKV